MMWEKSCTEVIFHTKVSSILEVRLVWLSSAHAIWETPHLGVLLVVVDIP
jgi:hypothetical protein